MTIQAFRPFDSLEVVAYIIKRCDQKGIYVNITKLQKLLYCCYGVVLAKFGVRLTDEHPEAWQYGPVFPETLRSIQFFGKEAFLQKETPDVDAAPAEMRALIDATLEHFGQHTALKLSNWTHLPGSPWSKTSRDGQFFFDDLDDDDIKTYFSEKVLA